MRKWNSYSYTIRETTKIVDWTRSIFGDAPIEYTEDTKNEVLSCALPIGTMDTYGYMHPIILSAKGVDRLKDVVSDYLDKLEEMFKENEITP